MATIVSSTGLQGIGGYRVQVEVQFLPGVESVSIVGLPDISIKESKDRSWHHCMRIIVKCRTRKL